MSGTLPARREGPPLHIHALEDEQGQVISGTLSARLDGKTMTVGAGGWARFPKGSAHRWWNAGDKALVIQGIATPAVDLDRFLHALFEVLNASDSGRPPIFYLAHVLHRHRKTQTTLVLPRIVQSAMFPILILIGTALGKYRGNAWPGCPERCVGAPSSSIQTGTLVAFTSLSNCSVRLSSGEEVAGAFDVEALRRSHGPIYGINIGAVVDIVFESQKNLARIVRISQKEPNRPSEAIPPSEDGRF
ncbi:MAG TPA: cupin domain-containing protein [Candidatus Didemnitutus sp.]|nr:cupin domain-containing protein [Candidatus Didemnitutus sp.]